MSKSKHIDKICIVATILVLAIAVLFMFGEKLGINIAHDEVSENASKIPTANDENADWDKASTANVSLNGDAATITGTGAYFSEGILHIVYPGKYVISGTLEGSIQIDADGDDQIFLLFDGVNITSKADAPLYINKAGKVFLTLNENAQNTLTYENGDDEAKIDGSIFSRSDLTIDGEGELTVVSSSLHGIVCNDGLELLGGKINVTAKKDAVHVHDAVKVLNTNLTVSAGDDGVHVENDDETATFYLESGCITITECYEGIEANDITIAGGTVDIVSTDDGINANGRGSTSLITISGGDIVLKNPNGRDADGLDSNGSINITGGNLFISILGSGSNNAIDYGSENGGKFTITGGNIIACGSSQMAEAPDSDSTQGFIMQSVSGKANDILSVLDSSGKEIISKEIPYLFTSVIISSPEITIGDTVKMKIGDSETEITISNTVENRQGNQMPFRNGDRDKTQRPDGGDDAQWPRNPDERGMFGPMPDGIERGGMQRPDDKKNLL